jgi:hypothetical protein
VPPTAVRDVPNDEAARKLIPGAYEQNTRTRRQPGTMGGSPFGSIDLPVGASTMSAATRAERHKEGGGGTVNISNESWYTLLSRCFHRVRLVAIILLASWPVAAADLGTYREFTIGASTADVIARTGAAERDMKTLHERPALLQELSWRSRYASGRNSADRDSVAAIVFSFIDNQLFRMAIDYDRSRTEGLTKEDMITSLSAMYGPRSTRPAPIAPRPTFDSLDTPTVFATWRQGDLMLTLNQSTYGGGFSLVITSVPLEALARKAQATAVTMDAREAPAREAAQAKQEADAARAAAEKTRTTNRDAFKP